MRVADLYIREKIDRDGQITEELWVALRKRDGTIIRKLRFRDYERVAMDSYPLRNRMLLYFYKYFNQKDNFSQTLIPGYDEAMDAPNPRKSMTRWAKNRRMSGIIITGIDKVRTYKPDNNSIHHFYFHLSKKPPERWVQIFTREGEKRLNGAEPGIPYIWVEEKHVVIRCRLKGLRVTYLSDVRKLMDSTNKKYRQSLTSLMKDGMEAGIDNGSMEEIVRHLYGRERASLS